MQTCFCHTSASLPCPRRTYHRDTAMLELGMAEPREGRVRAILRDAHRVPVSKSKDDNTSNALRCSKVTQCALHFLVVVVSGRSSTTNRNNNNKARGGATGWSGGSRLCVV